MATRGAHRAGVLVPAMKVGLPLLAHAVLVAAVVAEFTRPCNEDNPWRERLVAGGGVVAGVAVLTTALLYFPRDRWSRLGARAALGLAVTGGVVLLATYGHCVFA